MKFYPHFELNWLDIWAPIPKLFNLKVPEKEIIITAFGATKLGDSLFQSFVGRKVLEKQATQTWL